MNNKGQTLVIFVILLPIFLLLLAFVVDYGFLSIEKRRIDNNTYDAVGYYLENISDDKVEEKTRDLLESNLENIEINITDNDDFIVIEVKSNYKNLFSSVTGGNIIIKYKGIKTSKEIIKG